MAGPVHLVRRFMGALSRAEPLDVDVDWVGTKLLSGEMQLWMAMPVHDRRHSIQVARRYELLTGSTATRDELAAALLHDVGKTASSLGLTGRVAATLVGPRGRRFREYHEHEAIGASMCRTAGSSTTTVSMIEGTGDARTRDLLRVADEI